jgi:phosphoenolpyruvate synthase/pyruvate phosphate dikinase
VTGQAGAAAFRRLVPLDAAVLARDGGTAIAGAKAARLSAATRAGLPVLPGWVVPCAEARPALDAAAAAVRGGNQAAARRAALSYPVPDALGGELSAAVAALGGRVIVRSSSPLERDPRWSGAFSSIAEVGAGDAVTAVRSCWAAAFAADPQARLERCGLAPEALELGVVIQPELRPDAGGTARVTSGPPDGVEVEAEGVAGHPGPLLAGWAEGVSGAALASLIGARLAARVARLAVRAHRLLGDDTIEWAAAGGKVWLLQSLRSSGRVPAGSGVTGDGPRVPRLAGDRRIAREWMPVLAAEVRARGQRLRGRPAAPGVAAGRLVRCRPHERPAAVSLDAILLVDRPVPGLAPLLFGARGLIARTGAASSHLADVARSLAVPMVTGCRLPDGSTASQPGATWLAAIDGTTGDVALLPG